MEKLIKPEFRNFMESLVKVKNGETMQIVTYGALNLANCFHNSSTNIETYLELGFTENAFLLLWIKYCCEYGIRSPIIITPLFSLVCVGKNMNNENSTVELGYQSCSYEFEAPGGLWYMLTITINNNAPVITVNGKEVTLYKICDKPPATLETIEFGFGPLSICFDELFGDSDPEKSKYISQMYNISVYGKF